MPNMEYEFRRFSTKRIDSKSLGIKLKKVNEFKYFCAKRGGKESRMKGLKVLDGLTIFR